MTGASPALLAPGDVVLVSFPFTDLSGSKLRPALVAGRAGGDDVLVAFVTSRTFGGPMRDPRAEHTIQRSDPEFAATGLKTVSTIRLGKLATIHRKLVQRRLGRIGARTTSAVAGCLRYVFDL